MTRQVSERIVLRGFVCGVTSFGSVLPARELISPLLPGSSFDHLTGARPHPRDAHDTFCRVWMGGERKQEKDVESK